MNRIDPFQFRSLFATARSMAVVGNAPTILEHENGAKIDGHDIVVRFNRATTGGLEEKVGSRTDILVVNTANSRAMAPPPSETVRPRCIVCFVTPRLCPQAQFEEFSSWVGDIPIFMTFGPDLIDLPAERRTRTLTNGTYFLLAALRMFTLQRLFVTGFTMFGVNGGASAKYYEDNRPGVGSFHDLDVESLIFREVLASANAAVEMTAEVAALVGGASQSGITARQAARGPWGKKIAAGLSWRFINWGIKLRRLGEMQ